jgi:hypothetical protein
MATAKTAGNKKKGPKQHRSLIRLIVTTKRAGKGAYSFVEEMIEPTKLEETLGRYKQ